MPSWLHMTMPRTFRRSAPIPKSVVLHISDLSASDVEQIDGVLVTKALRTLIDVRFLASFPLPDLQLAFAEAIQPGKTPDETEEGRISWTHRTVHANSNESRDSHRIGNTN